MGRARHLAVATAALVATLVLSGCTSGDDTDDAPDGGDDTASQASQGPSPQELSEQVLDQSQRQQDAPAVATGGGVFSNETQLDVEVVSLERTATGVLLTARLSGGDRNLGPAELRSARNDGVNFARDVHLVDEAVTASRYLPLQFDDYRQACVCPYVPLRLGAETQTVTALYPPLPDEVATVDLVFNDEVTVPGVPVSS